MPTADDFVSKLNQLQDMNVEGLLAMVRLAAREEFIVHQSVVLGAAMKRLFNVQPRDVQLRVVRRLIYGIGDTILIARTVIL